ncbi:Protein CBG07878 [Caenorhabditis briggsae]|uniref:Protein CBG07878 n=1 Tax=Caenorhabditis briggsae TaxID=6238 RepID=A8X5C0_CAEBR|nr:Protein CBG07878 [Caenorhabditis briggsae]CAP27819.2 Protein CBG07878 [Caenorhabditis briggsae]
MAALELNERRSHGWPKFNPTKESFRSFIQRVNEHANATMRTEADALRALPTMLSEEYLEAYRAGINANDTWRTILDKIRDAVLTPAKCSEFQAKLSALSQGGLSVQEFAKQRSTIGAFNDSIGCMMNRLQLLWEQCREKNKKTSPQYGRINERQLKAGDSILVQRQQPENKLAPKLKGPFKVLEIKGKNVHFADDRKIIRTAHKDEVRGLPGPKVEDGIERHQCGQGPRRSKRIAEKKGERIWFSFVLYVSFSYQRLEG